MMAFFRSIGGTIGWLLGFIPRTFRYALSLDATQIRALMCWGMLLGVAVEGLTVIWLVMLSGHYDAALVRSVILYSEWLRIVMVTGVVFIAIQANSLKARLGDKVEFSAHTGIDREGESL